MAEFVAFAEALEKKGVICELPAGRDARHIQKKSISGNEAWVNGIGPRFEFLLQAFNVQST